MNKIEILQRIVSNHQCERIRIDGRKVLIDGFSASVTLNVYNALSPMNQQKMLSLSLDKMIALAYKLTEKRA